MLQISDIWLPCLILLVLWAKPTAAFGAGNIASWVSIQISCETYTDSVQTFSISKIEGQNWRHGDIEDMLATVACLQGHKWKSSMIKVRSSSNFAVLND
jgi:hypothetical protein